VGRNLFSETWTDECHIFVVEGSQQPIPASEYPTDKQQQDMGGHNFGTPSESYAKHLKSTSHQCVVDLGG
jgi:hypothetical protein